MARNRIIFSQSLVVVLLLLLGGCTMLGPDFKVPETQIPDKWSEQDNGLFQKPSKQESIAWWQQFNDPVLDKLIQTAYTQNLSLRIVGLRIMEARAQLERVKGQLFPQNQQATGDLFTIGSTGPSDKRNYNAASVGFAVGWEIDFWGKFRRGVESADANLLATMADYDDALVLLTAEIAGTYVNICTLEERIRLAKKNSTIQQDGLQLVTYQFNAGVVTELDVLQAKTLLATTQATIPNIQASLYAAKHGLALLLGMLPEDIDALLGKTEKIPIVQSKLVTDVPAELLRRRPDIRRAEMQAAAQSCQIGIAQTELYPSFSLLGSLAWSANDRGATELADIFDSNSFSYSVGPTFTWNLFNYGRLKNQVRIQDARLEQLLTAYQETVLAAAREVEDGMTGYVYANQEAEYLLQAIASSKKSMQLAMLQYEEGFVDYQRVLDSTRAMTLNQDQHAQVQGKISNSVIGLYKALGGGWQIREGKSYLPTEVQEKMEKRTDWGNLLQSTFPEVD